MKKEIKCLNYQFSKMKRLKLLIDSFYDTIRLINRIIKGKLWKKILKNGYGNI